MSSAPTRPRDRGMPLATFLIRLVWCCVLPLALLSGWLAWDRVRSIEARGEDEARSQARNFAASVDQGLAARIAALEMLARSPQLREARDWSGLYQSAQGFRQSFSSHVILADAQGRMLFHTRAALGTALPRLPRPAGHAAAPAALEDGRPAVGDVVDGPLSQQPLVAVAVPARRDDGTALVLLALIETSALQQQLDALQLPADWALALLDSQGRAIARRLPAGIDMAGAARFDAGLALSGWSVAVEIPRSAYRALWAGAAGALFTAVVGATLLGALAGLLAARRLGRAVSALAQPGTAHAGDAAAIAEIGAVHALLEAARRGRREAESNLSASEQRYEGIFEQAAVGIALVAPDGRWLRVNRKLCDIVGYTPQELLALTFQDITHPEDLDADLGEVRRMLAREITTYSMEKRYLRKDGAVMWVNLTVALNWQADGSPDCFISVVEDIQARRQAEAALRGSQQRLQLFIEHAPAALAMFDRDMRYLAASRRWLTDYGLEGQALAGRSHYEVFPEIPPAWREAHRRALVGEVLQADEERFERASGGAQWLRWVARPWRQGDGSVGGILIFTEDISARKQAETALRAQQDAALEEQRRARLAALNLMEDAQAERARAQSANAALRQSQAQLRQLAQAVEQGTESIIITDTEGRIEYVNEAFVRQSGYGREAVIGRDPRLLQSGRTPREAYAALWRALLAGQAWKGDFVNRRRDGSEYIDSAIVTPLRGEDGTVTHYVSVQEDVTERRRMAEELAAHREHLEELVRRRTAELDQALVAAESASRAKSAFLANMSHEIRTPMNAILGLTHLLVREGPAPQQAARLEKIEGAARHLLSIINDILDLSKIEAGKLRLEERDFALHALLDHVRSIVSGAAAAKGLALRIEGGDHTPLWLRGDDTRVRQALLNYAGNAVKFTARGHVTLRARLLAEEAERVQVRFEVEDSGPGVEPAVLPRLFEAFEQADVSTTRHHGGTGLGLAITRRLAALMGGETGASSTPGQGSTFWFTAWLSRGEPLRVGAPELAQAEAELRLRHAGARLLLAEDNFVNREVALELLRHAGLEVEVAENGRIALEKLAQQHFDLVLMDVQMPQMDGLAATRALRARAELAALPVLAMTANAFDEDRAACLAAGMNDFVAKPVDPEAMYATLLKWLPGARTPAAAAPGAPDGPGAAGAKGDLVARLALHPGVDVAAALANLPGMEGRYPSLLQLFAEHHGNDAAKLGALLAHGDTRGATLVAHSLKGVAATLGATELAAAARALEARLREGAAADDSALRPLVDELARVLEPLVRLVREAAGAP